MSVVHSGRVRFPKQTFRTKIHLWYLRKFKRETYDICLEAAKRIDKYLAYGVVKVMTKEEYDAFFEPSNHYAKEQGLNAVNKEMPNLEERLRELEWRRGI